MRANRVLCGEELEKQLLLVWVDEKSARPSKMRLDRELSAHDRFPMATSLRSAAVCDGSVIVLGTSRAPT
jgi:hypothetical protein